MVQKALNLATQETDNPDLRDRGYVYWRLLSTDPAAAKAVVLGEKPLISDSTTRMDDAQLDELISNISTLASVYHKPPETFVTKLKEVQKEKKPKKEKRYEESLLSHDDDNQQDSRQSYKQQGQQQQNILDFDSPQPVQRQQQQQGGQQQQQKSGGSLLDDLDGIFSSPNSMSSPQVHKEIVLSAQQGNGLQLSAAFSRRDNQTFMDLTFTNQTPSPMNSFAIQFNKNTFAITPMQQPSIQVVMPGQSVDSSITIGSHPSLANAPGSPISNLIQVAIKNNFGQFFFQMPINIQSLFTESTISKEEWLSMWKGIQDEHFRDIQVSTDLETLQRKLQSNNIHYIARRNVQQQDFLYFVVRMVNDSLILVELSISALGSKSCCRTRNPELVPLFEQTLLSLL